MNYTENYHLPQWVKDDRIMMEDFNDAMANIDFGLSGNRSAAEELRQSSGAMDEKNLRRLRRIAYNHYRAVTGTDPVPYQIGFFYQDPAKDSSNITGTKIFNGVHFAGKNGTGLTIEAILQSHQEVTPLTLKKGELPSATPFTATFTSPATGFINRFYLNGTYNNNEGSNTTAFRLTLRNLDTGSVEQTVKLSYDQKYSNAAFSEYVFGPINFLGGARYQIMVQPLSASCDMTAHLVLGTDGGAHGYFNAEKVTATHILREQEESLGGMVILHCNINGAGGELKLLWDGEERTPAISRLVPLSGDRAARELIFLREDVVPASSTLSFSFDCAEGGDFQFFDWGAVLF